MEDTVIHLQKLGFTEYEARAYLALIREHPATRYQLSQNASIPNAKIYEVVRRLQDRGLIVGLHSNPSRFIPLAPEELIAQLGRKVQESLNHLRQSLPLLATQPVAEWIWKIEGYALILDKAQELVAGATEEIAAALWHDEADVLASVLRAACERGVAITVLAYDPSRLDFGTVKLHGYEHRLEDQLVDARGRWMAVVADRQQVLVGQSLEQAATGVWTNQNALATLVRKYVLEHFLRE